jgi:hypothetical protein
LPDSAYESIEIYDELPDNRDLIKKIEYSIMFSPFLLVWGSYISAETAGFGFMLIFGYICVREVRGKFRDYFQELPKIQAHDNFSASIWVAICSSNQGDWEKANRHFSHAEYLAENNTGFSEAVKGQIDDVRESISDDWDGSESWNTEKEETIGELIRLAEEIAERWGENLINTPEAQYLDIDTPSKYEKLAAGINDSYRVGSYTATMILSRKLIENLLIEVLRYEFRNDQPQVYFDVDRNQNKSLKPLIENFGEHKNRFKKDSERIDQDLISNLNAIRKEGNSSAHSIEMDNTKEDCDDLSNNLHEAVDVLLSIRRQQVVSQS